MLNTIQNGKGSKPRSCFNETYRNNYDMIFGEKKSKIVVKNDVKKQKKTKVNK